MSSTVHSPTWWYRWLSAFAPDRCREVPHADDKFYIRRSDIIRWSTHVQRLVKRI